ncbi:unnamed protein product [Fraxinus pennsylvanica]|uniref:Uncharacterized protein n=1 Tax=Fraxinus pennsylvanica TaxID=56036 RepID=A0AAD1Z1B3_9LAMI|nr:unnamed protein product [Fraxinus pennsylvanica]
MEPFTSNFRINIFNFQALKFNSGKHIEDMYERDIKQREGNKLTDLVYPTSLNFEESLYQLEFDPNDMKLYNALQSSFPESFHYMERVDEDSWRKYGQMRINVSLIGVITSAVREGMPGKKSPVERATYDTSMMLIVSYVWEHRHMQDAMRKNTTVGVVVNFLCSN